MREELNPRFTRFESDPDLVGVRGASLRKVELMRSRNLWPCAVVLFALVSASNARAQSGVGVVRGTVKDQAGAVVQGATVSLVNPINGYTQTVLTGGDGAYRLIDVPFNRYTLTAEAKGFDVASRELTVRSSLVQEVDVHLAVASFRQDVNVYTRHVLEAV